MGLKSPTLADGGQAPNALAVEIREWDLVAAQSFRLSFSLQTDHPTVPPSPMDGGRVQNGALGDSGGLFRSVTEAELLQNSTSFKDVLLWSVSPASAMFQRACAFV